MGDDATTQVGRPGPDSGGAATVPMARAGKDLQVGAQLGRYLVVGVLGRGGMGVVYAAFDPALDRKIAVKLLSYVDDDETSQGRVRMQREAQALGRLTHENVITVYDVAEHDGAIYIAMEIVEGGTLREWRAKRPWREVLEGYLEAARGLAAAHAAGLVHRDFKPENVLVGSDGRIRVTDFGLARLIGADEPPRTDPSAGSSSSSALSGKLTVEGAVMGTPTYMAPEQIDGGVVDARTDQFSWCIALWEALYNEQPWPTGHLGIRSAAMKTDVPVLPAKSEVPREVGRVLLRGLSPEPSARFPSFDALIDELESVTRRRDPKLYAGGAALGMAALALVFVLGRSSSNQAVDAKPTCDDAGKPADSLWTQSQQLAVASAFAATNAPFASDASQAVGRAASAWREKWRSIAVDSCRATRELGAQTQEMFELRAACLAARRTQVDSLLGALAHADRATVERAPTLPWPDLDRCSDAVALQSTTAAPSDSRIDELETRLDAMERERMFGMSLQRAHELRPMAASALVEATAIGWQPTLARAYRGLAGIDRQIGDGKSARVNLINAAGAASQGGDLDELITDYLNVMDVESRLIADFPMADGWSQLADGTLARMGPRPEKQLKVVEGRAGNNHRAGRTRAARRDFERALALAEQAGVLTEEIDILGELAIVEGELDDLPSARKHLERAIPLAKEQLGQNHPRVAGLEHDFAVIEYREGKYAAALLTFYDALAGREASYGKDSVEYATTLEAMSVNELVMGGRLDVATQHAEEALRILVARLGEGNPDVANAYNDVGGAYHRTGQYARAQALAKKTLAVREKALGPDHPDVGESLVNYAIESKWLKQWDEVEPSYERALKIFEKAYGEDNTTTAIVHMNYAEALRFEGKFDRSGEHYDKARAALAKTLGENHPLLAHVWNGIGQLELARGHEDLAVPLLERAVKMRESDGEANDLAESRFALARALYVKNKDRAVVLATAARDAYRDSGAGFQPQVDEIEAWLHEHRR